MYNKVPYSLIKEVVSLPESNYVIIDTETTGLKAGYDEVLSVAIVGPDGSTLFSSLIKPRERRRWDAAAKIHGIRFADVKDSPTLRDVQDEIMSILNGADLVVGYNTTFDMEMLRGNGLPVVTTPLFDLMKAYSAAYGDWDERHKDYRWVSLSTCARRYGFEFGAHDALEDAKATAFCFRAFRAECEAELPNATEEEKRRVGRAEALQIARLALIIILVTAAVLIAIFNPTLFFGVIFFMIVLLWMAYRMFRR